MPMMAPFRKMFSRPVRSGWKPAPISMSDPRRPLVTKEPEVGTVTRERIFRSVLFPAPFIPINPSTSPRLTEQLTSRRAQNSSRGWTARPRRRAARRPTSSLIEVTYQPWRSRYRLETPERVMAVSDMRAWILSDYVRKGARRALKDRKGQSGDDDGDDDAPGQGQQVGGGAQDEGAPVSVDDGGHGIEHVEG